MRECKVVIEGQERVFRYGLRAMFLFERLSGKAFQLRQLQDMFLFYFCCLIAADPDFMEGDFARFIEACDADPSLGRRLDAALTELSRQESALDAREESDPDGKKKD